MILEIEKSFSKNIIVPYLAQDKKYYLLFNETGIEGPFVVQDSDLCLSTFLYVGDLLKDNKKVGYIFYSSYNVISSGAFLLAYSGVYKESISNRLPGSLEASACVLKTKEIQIYHEPNKSTLVICPALSKKIRSNLEI